MAKREWMTEDFGWKLFSVFLAVVIWVTVHKIREEPEASTVSGDGNTYGDLPVLVVSSTTDVHDVRIVPNKVDVKVNGPPDIMETLQANKIHAFVNLTGIDSAHDLQRDVEVSSPRGVTLISIDPPQLIVTIPKKQ
jgi:YbbR domain-containing protein